MSNQEKKIFIVLFISMFATTTGVGIVVPLLPVYASSIGAKGFFIGLIFGAFSISRTIFLPVFGRLSDLTGRKPYIVAGLICYTFISAAFIFATSIKALVIVRFLQGIASGMIMPVVLAYIGDITPKGKEGIISGVFNMSLFLGLSFGPVIGGVLNDMSGLTTPFICMGVLSMVGLFLSLFLLPKRANEKILKTKAPPADWKNILLDKDIIGLFFLRFSYTSSISLIWCFLPVYASEKFAFSSTKIGFLVMLGVLVSGLLQPSMGWTADRLNRRALVAIGGLIASFALLSLSWTAGFWSLFFSNVLFGVGGGVATPAHMAIAVSKGSHMQAMGSVMSIMTVAHSMGMVFGSIVGGLMMDFYQLESAFAIGATVMVMGVVVFMPLTKNYSGRT